MHTLKDLKGQRHLDIEDYKPACLQKEKEEDTTMITPRTALGVLQMYFLGFVDAEFLGAVAKKIIESLGWSRKTVVLYRGSRRR